MYVALKSDVYNKRVLLYFTFTFTIVVCSAQTM